MKLKWIGVLFVVLLASACNRRAEQDGSVTPGTASTDATGAGANGAGANGAVTIVTVTPASDQPTIEVANWEETQQLVAQNPGKVVILDLWASW
jgi:hypothetical protein